MNVLAVAALYPNQQACIAHLERVRWGNRPACPYCGGLDVARKREGKLVGRWNCHDCRNSFNVLAGTVLQKTKIPLVKWFAAIALIVNAKKSLSSCQLARDLEMNQGTAWYLMQRVRAAMAADQGPLLRGIVEADETFLGGRPRKRNRRRGGGYTKRGRGTNKTAVIGAVERGGDVKAMVVGSPLSPVSDLSGRGILQFIQESVDPEGSLLISDEYKAYRAVRPYMAHQAINHQERYSDRSGGHTNTIEGFWSLLKRAWYGQHHHYSKDFSPLYVAEASWKYNHRKDTDSFGSLVRAVFA